MKKAYLILANGTILEGTKFGADKETCGELIFTTAMTGYVENLTNPSFCGQILVGTFPLAGNYGINEEDEESDTAIVHGFVVRQLCDAPSNFRMTAPLDKYMKKRGIVGLCDIDTRQLMMEIREHGILRATIVDEVTDEVLNRVQASFSSAGRPLPSLPSANSTSTLYPASPVQPGSVKQATPGAQPALAEQPGICKEQILTTQSHTVAVIDCGVKKSLIRELTAFNLKVTLFSCDTSAQEILAFDPDGIIIAGGSGDPAAKTITIANINGLLGHKPMLGIGLGHQLLALAAGAETVQMKCGHFGKNYAVLNPQTGETFITDQSHRYAVLPESIPADAKILFINPSDMTCEGLKYPRQNAFSVQFHLTRCSEDKLSGCKADKLSKQILDRFTTMMGGNTNDAKR